MAIEKEKKMKLRIKSYHKKGNSTSTIRRIIYLALAALSLGFFSSCKNNDEDIDVSIEPSVTIEIPTLTPEPTPTETIIEVIPTPKPTPIEFSYENVFKEIFNDAAILNLYPDIYDFEAERTRIFNNISKIEDFEFYDLTEEEQIFIKEAQLGNIQESDKEKLIEIFTKILQNDPNVFDDVYNDIKINNRTNILMQKYNDFQDRYNIDFPMDELTFSEVIKACNGAQFEPSTKSALTLFKLTNMYNEYIYDKVLSDYQNNNWTGDYDVIPVYLTLLDGSEGQKLSKEYYALEQKLLTSNKKNTQDVAYQFLNKIVYDLYIAEQLGEPGSGLFNLDSNIHIYIIYRNLEFIFSYPTWNMTKNLTYYFPEEYVVLMNLPISKIKIKEMTPFFAPYSQSNDLKSKALEEFNEAQEVSRIILIK